MFFAFFTFSNDAIFGTFNLKSQVIITGNFNLRVSSPESTSRVTSTFLSFNSIFEANVACGHFNNPAKS